MKLYHWTYRDCLDSILREGFKPSGMGFSYLSPVKRKPTFGSFYRDGQLYEVLLEVETGDNKLGGFDHCKKWEIFCKGVIPPERIKVLIGGDQNVSEI